MKTCNICNEKFNSLDDVAIIDGEIYHEKCIEIIPTGFVAYIDGCCLGEVEDRVHAMDILDDEDLERENQC